MKMSRKPSKHMVPKSSFLREKKSTMPKPNNINVRNKDFQRRRSGVYGRRSSQHAAIRKFDRREK